MQLSVLRVLQLSVLMVLYSTDNYTLKAGYIIRVSIILNNVYMKERKREFMKDRVKEERENVE